MPEERKNQPKVVNSLTSVEESLRNRVDVPRKLIAKELNTAIIEGTSIYVSDGFLNPKHPAHPSYWTRDRKQEL